MISKWQTDTFLVYITSYYNKNININIKTNIKLQLNKILLMWQRFILKN